MMRNGFQKRIFPIVLLLSVGFFSFAQPNEHTNRDVAAKISVGGYGDIAKVVGYAVNNTDVYKSLTYNLTVFRTTFQTENLTKNEQISEFSLEPNQTKELAAFDVNLSTKDKIVILLLIYEDEKIVGVSRVAYNEEGKGKTSAEGGDDNEKEDVVEEDSDGIEIRGIVVDETKTKFGRDFYEYFFTLYNNSGINGDRIVKVFEKFGRARSTIIEVSVEDEKVYEFIARPRDEYLQTMAQNSLRLVFRQFKSLEKQQEYIRY